MKDVQLLDFSNTKTKRMVLDHIKGLTGKHWFDCRKARNQRTLSQNAYLWAVVYPAVARAMSESWGETQDSESAHEFLKARFLSKSVIDWATGEEMGSFPRSTTSLDTSECVEYINNIIKFAAEYLHIEIPSPEEKEVEHGIV